MSEILSPRAKIEPMQTYLVGGAVRDAFLHTHRKAAPHLPVREDPPTDRDWVVVGGSPQAMLAQGFKPVGKDFPVFLHPQTREEYALARTERKNGRGYQGFEFYAAPDVTLQDDLARRDLTINAVAQRLGSAGEVLETIDPFGGLADLQAGVLRHVSDAFAEDPVRILRVARFAARLPTFEVAPSTLVLMQSMVHAGEVQHLVAERVWQELSRALMEAAPQRFFTTLRACGALQIILPEVDALWGIPQRAEYHPEIDTGVHVMMVLQLAAAANAPLAVRFACLCHDLGKATTPADVLPRHLGHEGRSVKLLQALCQRLRVPTECRELAEVVAAEHGNIHRSEGLNAAALLRLLKRCDALRRPERFAQALQACECDARGRLGFEDRPYPQAQRLQKALQAALSVTFESLNLPPETPPARIAQSLDFARERAIELALI